ncbi:MAG: hypothetical protein AAGJ93_16615, partial [Bacteroidota bacterium]
MKDFERLEQLLQTKNYEELTALERSFVEGLMTEASYTAQRELLGNVKQVLPQAPPPPPALAGNLRKAVTARKTGYNYLHIVGVTAALVAGFIIGRWSLQPQAAEPHLSSTVSEIATINTPIIHDTIYLEKTIEKVISEYIYREKIIRDTIYIQAFADKGLL